MSVYAISDIHGHLDIYQQVKDFVKPHDIVYCLGDCGDRGPRGFETICAVYQDPQWHYLKGNHEDMLVKAIQEAKYDDYNLASMILIQNGGYNTLEGFRRDAEINGHEKMGMWQNRLDKLGHSWRYHNKYGKTIWLTHAGCTPPADPYTPANWAGIDVIWSRNHFLDKWPEELEDHIMVHGHTPVHHLITKLHGISGRIDEVEKIISDEQKNGPIGAVWYCNDHKVDIDCGTVYSKYAVLLDLDTFEEHIFETEE